MTCHWFKDSKVLQWESQNQWKAVINSQLSSLPDRWVNWGMERLSEPAQCHIARMWYRWDLNPESDSKPPCYFVSEELVSVHGQDRVKNTIWKGKSWTPSFTPSSASPPGPVLMSYWCPLTAPRSAFSSHSQQLASRVCPSCLLSCPCLDYYRSLLAVRRLQSLSPPTHWVKSSS